MLERRAARGAAPFALAGVAASGAESCGGAPCSPISRLIAFLLVLPPLFRHADAPWK
jgi:hypothetical protein